MSVKANVFIEFVNLNIGLTDYNKFNNFIYNFSKISYFYLYYLNYKN